MFRKYSAEKHREFACSTGLEAIDRNAATAYKIGLEKFNTWLGLAVVVGRQALVRDVAKLVLNAKDSPDISPKTLELVRDQIARHIIPTFGHLRPDQIEGKWREYQTAERKRTRVQVLKDGTAKELPPRTKLFNTHKVLMEILRRSHEKGLIKKVPTLELKDGEAKPPKYISKSEILQIIRFAGRIKPYTRGNGRASRAESRRHVVPMKLWVFMMWKQGARPGEIIQYRYSMINFSEGSHGMLSIPASITKTRRARKIPLNPKVARILKFLHSRSKNDLIFPSSKNPSVPMAEYKSGWGTVMRRLGLPYEPYNLRDTFITNALKRGLSSTFVARYCDNSAAIIEKKYAVAIDSVMEEVARA